MVGRSSLEREEKGWSLERIKELERALTQVIKKPGIARAIILRLGFYDSRPLSFLAKVVCQIKEEISKRRTL
jgi:hypothetical protein